MSAKEVRAVQNSPNEVRTAVRLPCDYRGEGLRLHECRPCRGRSKGAVIYECGLKGECTLLSHSAKNEKGERLPVCLACDDRISAELGPKAAHAPLLVDETRSLANCMYFGRHAGRRQTVEGEFALFECSCDKIKASLVTVEHDCHGCNHRLSREQHLAGYKTQRAKEGKASMGPVPVFNAEGQPEQEKEEVSGDKQEEPERKPKGRRKRKTRAERVAEREARNFAKMQKKGQRHPCDMDPSVCVDRGKRPANVANLFHNTPLFLMCGGPSLNKIPFELLQQRGVLTMGINNVSAYFHTDLFIHGDPSKKFHDSIWRSPSIMKFTPKTMLSRDVRTKQTGEFRILTQVKYMPNVFGYKRNSTFTPDTFLTEDSISFGNGKDASKKNGLPRVLSTMFSAIKMGWYLGCPKIYLLGCDFDMEGEKSYAFDQGKSQGASRANMSSYRAMAKLFSLLVPHFKEHGFEVFNCNPDSRLQVFPYHPLDEAVAGATANIEQQPDTKGWYDDYKSTKKGVEDD